MLALALGASRDPKVKVKGNIGPKKSWRQVCPTVRRVRFRIDAMFAVRKKGGFWYD